MKNLSTTTFARPLVFTYLSTFNGDTIFNGTASFNGDTTFNVGPFKYNAPVYACGNLHIAGRLSNLYVKVEEPALITGYPTSLGPGLTSEAAVTLDYFTGVIILTQVTVLQNESIRILLSNTSIHRTTDMVFAQVISSAAAADPLAPIWAVSTRIDFAGSVYIYCYNVGGDTTAAGSMTVGFKVYYQVNTPSGDTDPCS